MHGATPQPLPIADKVSIGSSFARFALLEIDQQIRRVYGNDDKKALASGILLDIARILDDGIPACQATNIAINSVQKLFWVGIDAIDMSEKITKLFGKSAKKQGENAIEDDTQPTKENIEKVNATLKLFSAIAPTLEGLFSVYRKSVVFSPVNNFFNKYKTLLKLRNYATNLITLTRAAQILSTSDNVSYKTRLAIALMCFSALDAFVQTSSIL
jgi:hypothetical protein